MTSAITLQKRSQITLHEAKTLNAAGRKIIEDAFYFKQLLNGRIQFSSFKNINLYQASILLHPQVKLLIDRGILSIEEVLSVQGKLKIIFLQKSILKLLFERKIAFAELKNISFSLTQAIDKNLCLYGLIHQGILTLTQCNNLLEPYEIPTQLLILWGLSFGGRLIGLFKNQPYEENEEADHLALVLKDLDEVSCSHPCYSREEIFHQAIKFFIRHLRNVLQEELNLRCTEGGFYKIFIEKLLAIEKNGLLANKFG